METLINWLKPPTFGEEHETRIGQLLYYILLTLIVYMVGRLVIAVVIYPQEEILRAFLIQGTVLALLVGLMVQVRLGRTRFVSYLIVFLLCALLCFSVYQTGVNSSGYVAFMVVILLSGLLLGNTATLVVTLGAVAIGFIFHQLQLEGILVPADLSGREQLFGNVTSYFVVIGIMTFVYQYYFRSALGDVIEKERRLSEANEALEHIRSLLEKQVEEHKAQVEQARQDTEKANQEMQAQIWLAKGQAELANKIRGEQELRGLTKQIVDHLCEYIGAQVGTLFVLNKEAFQLMASYAYLHRRHNINRFKVGEGLVGQVALEKQPIVLNDVPDGRLTIASGLGQMPAKIITAFPILYTDEVMGVVELGSLHPLSEVQMRFLQEALTSVGVALNTAQARDQINKLLVETQNQANILAQQEEELRATNEELAAQTDSLRLSESKLRQQQTQLERTNAELEETASVLREKQKALDKQNQDLKLAQIDLQAKAEQLARASQYKSEFLANMSHELRTPLNSLLILARMLSENEHQNLSDEEVESATIIYKSGQDLLQLINEILDLSKIEAGQMTFLIEEVSVALMMDSMKSQFTHVAQERGLAFELFVSEDVPATIRTDKLRVEQIIKNLLSNAFKFTEAGTVSLLVQRPLNPEAIEDLPLSPNQFVAIEVRDTGIGMSEQQQQIVFEGFKQADGSTSRRYGGTGLGLTISRELITRLGGKITLESVLGEGSVFTIYLPIETTKIMDEAGEFIDIEAIEEDGFEFEAQLPTPTPAPVRESEDKTLLIIEDDERFAKIICDYANQKGFHCITSISGEEGLKIAQNQIPDAIILDLRLPQMTGWQVLEKLKKNLKTRHIPVHIMSADNENLDAYKMGAIGYLSKPVSQEDLDQTFQTITHFTQGDVKNLLLVEDDQVSRLSIRRLLGGSDVNIQEAITGQTALKLLQQQTFDCMILDLRLPDMTGFEILNEIENNPKISKCPVIIYTGQTLTEEENAELMEYADTVIVKGVKSRERLLDETALFLHRVVSNLPEEKQKPLAQLYERDMVFTDKHVLAVDDDMRNVFAMSKLLRDKGLKVTIARSGSKALEILEEDHSEIDLVLMDIMMPDMDGYETMRRIRAQEKFRQLPILALTAKAMKGDAEKCIQAGANDYLAKPIDSERLFAMLQVWLYKNK